MTKDRIPEHFVNQRYNVYHCFSGVYTIRPPRGPEKVFRTLSEAHKFYLS